MAGFRARTADPQAARELGRAVGIAPALAQVLLHRGLHETATAREYLAPQLSGLTQPDRMLDRDRAADRLAHAVRNGERVAVFGDYDVDGTTSAAILADTLTALGGQVVVHAGHRFDGGYGLSDAALDRVLADRPALLVTCDCGSSDHERIARAKRAGVDTIVVDHHLVPEEELPALAFINPHRPQCGFAYKGLASAGLALSLAAALRAQLGASLDLRNWLDLVALGTIADVAPLTGDNRRLVRAGLARIVAAQARPGVAALRDLARIRAGSPLSAVDVAFRLAPRINAAGRMGDPMLAISLLRARDASDARKLAAALEQHNDQRKEVEKRVTASAIAQVIEVYGEKPSGGVIVAHDDFHRGVIGITAARLVERFGVPAVVVGWDGDTGHGSARTPQGFSLYDALSACAADLVRFGGHHAAAGVTLARDRLEGFRSAFASASQGARMQSDTTERWVDVELDPAVFEIPSASDLLQLEPLGEGNAEPVFRVPSARVLTTKVIGGAHLKLGLQVGGASLSAFGYDLAGQQVGPKSTIAAVGMLRPDAWAADGSVELRLLAIEP